MQRADGTTVVAGISTVYVTTFGMITTACKNPEVVMRWVDSIYSPEMREYLIYGGEEGKGWEWKDGVKSIAGADRAVVSLLDVTERNAIWLPDWVGSWVTEEMYCNNAAESDSAEAPLRVADGKLYDQVPEGNRHSADQLVHRSGYDGGVRRTQYALCGLPEYGDQRIHPGHPRHQ